MWSGALVDSDLATSSRPDNDSDENLLLHQPANLADAAQVVFGIAKGVFDHG